MQFNNLFISQTGASVACGRTIHSHNSLAPHAGHTLLWDGIPFFNQHLSQVSQRGCVGHSGTNSTPMLIPQVFNGVEVRSASRPYHLLHSNILEVDPDKPRPVGASVVILEDRVRSQTVEIWDCHWLQISSLYLSALRLPPMMTSLVFPVREKCRPTPSHCLHQKMLSYRCSNQHSVLHVFSTL